ncbi:MAG: rhomboid family intramembrane serine protease [Myxococcota bacterium]
MSRSMRRMDLARRLPVTLGIALATLLMFVLQRVLAISAVDVQGFVGEFLLGDTFDSWRVMLRLGALRSDRIVEHGEYFRLLTPVLLHGGWLHVGLNLLALVQLSALVEMLWGGRRLVFIYVLCGLAGSLCSATLNDPTPPLAVGASGAILGLAGVLMGTMWFGPSATAQWLTDLLGRRLLTAVLLTFGLGIALLFFVGPLLDNWAHFGGFACGMLIAATLPSPTEPEDLAFTLPTAGLAGLVLVGAVGWMAIDGDNALQTAEVDFARLHAESASRQPESNQATLVRMLQWFAKADALDEGLETFERQVERYEMPASTRLLVGAMYQTGLEAEVTDPALIVVAERWVELAPNDPEALNTLAWFLVTPETTSLRDPDRAEPLSRRSLRELTPDDALQEATYLDTLGEVLYQKGAYVEAYEVQQRALSRLDAAGEAQSTLMGWLAPLPRDLFTERLDKIEEAQRDAG